MAVLIDMPTTSELGAGWYAPKKKDISEFPLILINKIRLRSRFSEADIKGEISRLRVDKSGRIRKHNDKRKFSYNLNIFYGDRLSASGWVFYVSFYSLTLKQCRTKFRMIINQYKTQLCHN